MRHRSPSTASADNQRLQIVVGPRLLNSASVGRAPIGELREDRSHACTKVGDLLLNPERHFGVLVLSN